MDIVCPCCESLKIKCTVPNYYNYDLIACGNCECVFCYPFEAPKYDFYSEADDWESIRRHSVISKWHRTHPTWQSKNLIHGEGKRLLDIGCGNGDFAEFASKRKFGIVGIDIDKASLKIANRRELENAQFINSTLLDFVKTNTEKFDIISMFEVFEHIKNPNQNFKSNKLLLSNRT
jgi:2-polyprenyl-3-methyl-5-hydroxy-6-metoxy-1,4-benzoquinol methylase